MLGVGGFRVGFGREGLEAFPAVGFKSLQHGVEQGNPSGHRGRGLEPSRGDIERGSGLG